ncbi:hypothetical protein [Pararhizobium gei]|uniref:hypothetical protein n=1 Tax=Pararhizobium gei TaxID=1395951 RepID=UPI0023DA09C2|nr:hypothetical protein [Rhizobium gei]
MTPLTLAYWTHEGGLNPAVVIDLLSRHVVGRAIADRLHREPAINGFYNCPAALSV